MRKERYTAPITAEEKARFVPFMHMLIDTAFDVIVPRFLTGLVSKDKADGSPVTEADKLAEEKMRRVIETLLATSHWTTGEQHGSPRIQTLIDRVKLYRTMWDWFGYFAVASGGADIMVDPELCYWDIAALLPVVEGAGGTITSTAGGNPLTDLSAVCTAGPLHGEVVALLNA